MPCWYCRREDSDKPCWVCEGKQGEIMTERENALSRRSSFSTVENAKDDFDLAVERPAPTYLAPWTKSSAEQSTDNIENQRPVRPKSFTRISNRSARDDPPPIIASQDSSDFCDFDFTDEVGPIISFIRSSGVSSYPRSADDDPHFGSIEIVRYNNERLVLGWIYHRSISCKC